VNGGLRGINLAISNLIRDMVGHGGRMSAPSDALLAGCTGKAVGNKLSNGRNASPNARGPVCLRALRRTAGDPNVPSGSQLRGELRRISVRKASTVGRTSRC
jgi:hypothetical protein